MNTIFIGIIIFPIFEPFTHIFKPINSRIREILVPQKEGASFCDSDFTKGERVLSALLKQGMVEQRIGVAMMAVVGARILPLGRLVDIVPLAHVAEFCAGLFVVDAEGGDGRELVGPQPVPDHRVLVRGANGGEL